MLTGLPLYLYFKNGNPFSGSEGGMRYLIEMKKKPNPADESGKKKLEYLTGTIWPGPWSLEHTAEEKYQTAEFEGSQQGLEAAMAWLRERYEAEPQRWAEVPSILDCEPDR